ncbi:MAG: carboxypeptidase regulatory-like domain-containing protein [Opitutaceae bacterium]
MKRILLLAALLAAGPLRAAVPTNTGAIEGRVFNRATGANLELARVTVEGTALEAFTDAAGQFRLGGVPAGERRVRIFYTGLGASTHPVTIPPDATLAREFALGGGTGAPGAPVRLAEFVVGDSREMSGTAIAINEQRFAPNLRSVVSVDEFGDSPDGNVAEFLKFLPGVNVNSAREVSINGVPSANVPVTIGGFSVASVIGSGGDGGTGRCSSTAPSASAPIGITCPRSSGGTMVPCGAPRPGSPWPARSTTRATRRKAPSAPPPRGGRV